MLDKDSRRQHPYLLCEELLRLGWVVGDRRVPHCKEEAKATNKRFSLELSYKRREYLRALVHSDAIWAKGVTEIA